MINCSLRPTKIGTAFTLILSSLLLSACSNNGATSSSDSYSASSNEILSPEEIPEGPGIFSGKKGGFYLTGGAKKEATPAIVPASAPSATVANTTKVSAMDLNESAKVLDEKIKQLEKDQIELELLKREIDRKLKAQ